MNSIFEKLQALVLATPTLVIQNEPSQSSKISGTGRIRASEIHSAYTSKLAVGDGLNTLARQLAGELVGAKKARFVSEAMEKGIENESIAIALFAEKRGVVVDCTGEDQAVYEWNCLIAKPDGVIFGQNSISLVEVKCIESPENWAKVLCRSEFMKHFSDYWIQVQFQIFLAEKIGNAVTESDLVFYRNSTGELRIFTIMPDRPFHAELERVTDVLREKRDLYLMEMREIAERCVIEPQFSHVFGTGEKLQKKAKATVSVAISSDGEGRIPRFH